ncbi:hypothetical protein BURKHO8Y_240290 [Burkholderia sp. 8Y]|nr:hypothetical protein BURKHO8Y_240290 [Burkholderia sp. 8Y]
MGEQKLCLSPVLDLDNGEITAYETNTPPAFAMVARVIEGVQPVGRGRSSRSSLR